MNKYKFVLWDLDGTIANTFEGVTNCVNHALSHFGMKIEDKETLMRFIGPPLRVSFPKVCGFDEEQTSQAVKLFRERYIPVGVYECSLFPGVREAMKRFRDAGMIQVITSSKPTPQCHNIVDKLGLTGMLDEVVGATLDGRVDSKLQVLNEAFRILGDKHPEFSKSSSILIGDTKYDAIGAREAGIHCIGVSYGFGSREELMKNHVIGIYDTLDEICDVII